MSTLVKETGAVVAGANAYADTDDGDGYAADHLYATDWTGATSEQKRKALIMATRLLDEQVIWLGSAADEDQELGWPRYGTFDRRGYIVDSNVVPTEVKQATWLLAMALLGEDRTEDPLFGFGSIGVGSVQLGIDKTNYAPIVPRVVGQMLSHLGQCRGVSDGTIRLVRA
jgi:hypothetical protein